MFNSDPRTARLHRRIYNQLLDELDNDVVKAIMKNPYSDEAQLLNSRVEAVLQKEIHFNTTQVVLP